MYIFYVHVGYEVVKSQSKEDAHVLAINWCCYVKKNKIKTCAFAFAWDPPDVDELLQYLPL